MATAVHEQQHHQHHHDPLPTKGRALDRVTLSATLHCLTGCAIGEILGMVIGTALGFSQWGTVALAVGLAFLFGYGLTSLPLLRAGFALSAVVPIALAADTFSIATMEIVDNAIMLAIPGAMEHGVGSLLFWGALSFALAVAGVIAFPVNRWLIARGKGHAVIHETGVHGGPSPRVVGAIALVAAVFGSTVLIAELASGDGGGHGAAGAADAEGGHGEAEQAAVRGLAVADAGMRLQLERTDVARGVRAPLRFRVVGDDGRALRDFEVEHERRMHLIVVRRDGRGFQHLHPRMGADGVWETPLRLDEAGAYRVFADFKRAGANATLAADLAVDGRVDWRAAPAPSPASRTATGYDVRLAGPAPRAGEPAELEFEVTRGGRPVEVEPYLGARGHLVALREGDLAYLHVHPDEHGEAIRFETELPTEGRYRLYLQFEDAGRVHTAPFTLDVAR